MEYEYGPMVRCELCSAFFDPEDIVTIIDEEHEVNLCLSCADKVGVPLEYIEEE